MEGETIEMSGQWTVVGIEMAGVALGTAHMTAQQPPGTQKALTHSPHELCQPDPQVLHSMHLIPDCVQSLQLPLTISCFLR